MIVFNLFASRANIDNNFVLKKRDMFYIPVKLVDGVFSLYIAHPNIKISDVNFPSGEILEQILHTVRGAEINYPHKYFTINETLILNEIDEASVESMRNI